MEKQHNRGQDGAGIANVKLDVNPGKRYISRKRSIDSNPIQDVFKQVNRRFLELEKSDPGSNTVCVVVILSIVIYGIMVRRVL
jgi:amidophosphoribosyltransferase